MKKQTVEASFKETKLVKDYFSQYSPSRLLGQMWEKAVNTVVQ
jgi:hypothetical protein